jgi:hypothetical protein
MVAGSNAETQAIDETSNHAFRRIFLATTILAGGITAVARNMVEGAESPAGTQLIPGELLEVQVAGRQGAPIDAKQAFVNLTVANTLGSGFLSIVDCENPNPTSSILNYGPNAARANNALVDLDMGKFCVMPNQSGADVIVDLSGTDSSESPLFETPEEPIRIHDTRGKDKILAGTKLYVKVAGVNGVPADAEMAMVNITHTQTEKWGFATMQDCDAPVTTSSVNYLGPNQDGTNTLLINLDETGGICIAASEGDTHALLDVQAWVRGINNTITTLDTPNRVYDSRNGQGMILANAKREINIAGVGAVPADARIIFANETIVGENWTYLSNGDCDLPAPNSSAVNVSNSGEAVANGLILKLNELGKICLFAGPAALHGIVDVIGFIPVGVPSSLDMLPSPQRLVDTRNGDAPTATIPTTTTTQPEIIVTKEPIIPPQLIWVEAYGQYYWAYSVIKYGHVGSCRVLFDIDGDKIVDDGQYYYICPF